MPGTAGQALPVEDRMNIDERRKERGRRYGARVDDALRVIAESCDYVCAYLL